MHPAPASVTHSPLSRHRSLASFVGLWLSASALWGGVQAQADPFAADPLLPDPFTYVWTRQATGRIQVVDRNNVVTYSIKRGQTVADRVQFVLVLGAGQGEARNFYRKSLFVASSGEHRLTNITFGTILAEDNPQRLSTDRRNGYTWFGVMVTPESRLATFSVLKSDLLASTALELHKDNFLSGFSAAAVLHDLEYLQGGDVVTILWEREQN
ncbi:hypothetical protein ACFFLM_18060 [Deinococcus oregonensis]|uniref:DUF3047 domain-containing protein n=1 Tax=Deinococcus oregonensis TaxID=1805970 RepID=A0ABV6B4Q2_9DEIO